MYSEDDGALLPVQQDQKNTRVNITQNYCATPDQFSYSSLVRVFTMHRLNGAVIADVESC